MTNIYILKLEKGNYYVGKTKDVDKRFAEHLGGKGSAWTNIHKPIEVEKIINDVSPFDEDKYVKEYMSKYGIDKVRGGSYVQEKLNDIQYISLKTEIWGAKDLCTRCGRDNHFVKDCWAGKDVDGNEIFDVDACYDVWCCEYCDQEYDNEAKCIEHEKKCKLTKRSYKGKTFFVQRNDKCYRCGREGHYAENCYAKTKVSNGKDKCYRCGTWFLL
jgi:predicted GIY-YIG superfamily endonuclease